MIKPHCEHFTPVADCLCTWWDFEQIGPLKKEWFCSRPAWEERVCETQGLRNMPQKEYERETDEYPE